MGLTKQGYKRETYNDILARMESRAKTLFGDDVNTSGRSALGMLLRVVSYGLSLVWQDNEDVYYSAYFSTAEGKQLDALLPYAGITRNPATAASGDVFFYGTPNTLIPLGTIVTKADDTLYYTIEEKRISSDGSITIEVMAAEQGPSGNADISEINALLNPMTGVDRVSNPIAITNGRERESDAEARRRAQETIEGLGSGTVVAIRSKLLDNPDVRAVYVDNNTSDETNEYGTPMRAIQCFVLGGKDEDIAQAILDKKAAGIQAYGQTVITIDDEADGPQHIGFTHAEIVQLYARVRLTTNASFPIDGHRQVRNAMVSYVGGLDEDDVARAGLSMGDDVILTKLIAYIYTVQGIDDVTIELSTDNETFVEENIIMARPQIAQISANSIEVV